MPAFVDTNVLVYCTDAREPVKRQLARTLVTRLVAGGELVISTQVLIELFNTLTLKQKMPAAAARTVVEGCTLWPVIDSDLALVTSSIDLGVAHGFRVWDAMIIGAALQAGAHTLFTEDLQHGRRFGALTVVNPFLAA